MNQLVSNTVDQQSLATILNNAKGTANSQAWGSIPGSTWDATTNQWSNPNIKPPKVMSQRAIQAQ